MSHNLVSFLLAFFDSAWGVDATRRRNLLNNHVSKSGPIGPQ